jgi:hypothetical protein
MTYKQRYDFPAGIGGREKGKMNAKKNLAALLCTISLMALAGCAEAPTTATPKKTSDEPRLSMSTTSSPTHTKTPEIKETDEASHHFSISWPGTPSETSQSIVLGSVQIPYTQDLVTTDNGGTYLVNEIHSLALPRALSGGGEKPAQCEAILDKLANQVKGKVSDDADIEASGIKGCSGLIEVDTSNTALQYRIAVVPAQTTDLFLIETLNTTDKEFDDFVESFSWQ